MKPNELPELIADVKEQVLYLKELGIDSFAVDLPDAAAPKAKRAAASVRESVPHRSGRQ